MTNFVMKYDNGVGLSANYNIGMDETLEEVFAKFVDITRIMGYQSKSWDHLLQNIIDIEEDGISVDYDMFDWSIDTLNKYQTW